MKKLLVVCLLLLLFGCGPDHEISEGVVVNTSYKAPWDEWHEGYYTNGICLYRDSKSGICYVYSQDWHEGYYEHHQADYDILVEGEKEDGTKKREWFDVTNGVYDSCSIGQYFNGDNCESGSR